MSGVSVPGPAQKGQRAGKPWRGIAGLGGSMADLLPAWGWAESALTLCLAGLFAARYVALSPFEVVGADNANYLLTMRQVFGDDATGAGLLRPPMVGLLLKPLVMLMPLTVAFKIAGIVSSLIIALPFFKLSKRYLSTVTARPELPSLLATVGFVSSYQLAAMLAFGWLTFWGIFLLALLVVKALDIEQQPSMANVGGFALVLAAIAATHQTTLFIAMLVVASVLTSLAAWTTHRWASLEGPRHLVAALAVASGLAAALSLPLAPLYLRHASDYTREQFPGAPLDVSNLWAQLQFFFHDAPEVWLLAAWMALVGLAVVVRRQGAGAATWMLALLLVPIAINLTGMDASHRALMFAYIPLWLLAPVGLAWNLNALGRHVADSPRFKQVAVILGTAAPVATIGAMAGYQAFAGSRYLGQQAATHSSIDSEAMEAARWLGSQLPPGSAVIAYPFSLGWWLEGAEGLNAFEVGSFPRKSQTHQSDIAQAALFGSDVIFNGRSGLAWTGTGYAPGAPHLLIRADKEYQLSGYLDEDETIIHVNSGGAEEAVKLGNLQGRFQVQQEENGLAGVSTYSSASVTVIQNSAVHVDSDRLTISYVIEAKEGHSLRGADISMRFNSTLARAVRVLPDSSVLVSHVGRNHKFLLQPVTILITSRVHGGGAEVELADSVVQLVARSDEGSAWLAIDLFFDFDGLARWEREPVHLNTAGALAEHSIAAIALDERPVNGLVPLSDEQMRWLSASPLYRQVYQQGRIRVFEVVRSPQSGLTGP